MRCGTEFAAGRGEVLFDLSFGVLLAAKLDSQHPRIHRTSSYNDRIFARHIQPAPPNNYTPLSSTYTAIITAPITTPIPISAHLQPTTLTRKSLRLRTHLARSLA